jgi:thymidylate kinase
VYIVYHFPFMSRIPPTLRFWALRLFFGSKQNVTIVYLDADPGRCIDRINRRGEEVQKHENQRDLGKLSAEFEKMIAVAKNSGFEILRIDVNVKSAAEVTEEVELAVRRKLCALA